MPPLRGILYKAMARKVNVPAGRFLFFAHGIITLLYILYMQLIIGMAEHEVKKEQLINWKILKQSEGQLLATNAYALLTSDYFPFSKTQCALP